MCMPCVHEHVCFLFSCPTAPDSSLRKTKITSGSNMYFCVMLNLLGKIFESVIFDIDLKN